MLLVLEKNYPLRKETTVQKYNKKHLVIQKIVFLQKHISNHEKNSLFLAFYLGVEGYDCTGTSSG